MANRTVQRTEFVAAFNKAFGPEQIDSTLMTLRPFLPSIDALEIVQRLGLLTWIRPESFLRYREVVGIPPSNVQVLTMAIHAALLAAPRPTPLRISIVAGRAESVALTHHPDYLELTLTRTRLEPEIPQQP